MARPTKMTKDRGKVIIEALKRGLSIASAAKAGGIAESTFHAWIKQGMEATRKNMFSEFSEGVDSARVDKAIEYLDAVERSILKPTEVTKKLIRRIPTGEFRREATGEHDSDGNPTYVETPLFRETTEIIKYTKPPPLCQRT